MNEIIFSDEYDGPRWTYGLNLRPMHSSHVPHGYIMFSDGAHDNHAKFGTIDYPRELTHEETERYTLTLVTAPAPEGPQ